MPVGAWLIQGVENRYEHPAAPNRVDGILILGGGSKTDILLSRHALGMDHGLVRLVEGAVLARQYPSAKVVFSGGSGDPRHQEMPEAISARAILLSLGVPPERLTIEGKSRNTWENFVFTKEIVKPKPGDTWLLVTSGFHMPRSAGIAQKVGWKVLPWPVDFTTPARVPFSPETVPENLERTDLAVHEYIGAVIYRLTGKAS
nr:YdcF family protein [Rhizomicrobium palustre]